MKRLWTSRLTRALLALATVVGPPATLGQQQAEPDPKDIGLVERSGSRLSQIDITVHGPPEVVSALTQDDFFIKVHFRKIDNFILDRYCGSAAPERMAEATETNPGAPNPAAVQPRATYMFFLDQPHLTLGGRQTAITMLRGLIRELVHDGARAMLISNARELQVVQRLTDDPKKLLAAVDRLEHDRQQFDTYASSEDIRVSEVVNMLNDQDDPGGGVDAALLIARRHQREETWRAERSMRRLSMTLARLSEAEAPKAVLYFADTMRSNAGEHYMSFFGRRIQMSRASARFLSLDASMGRTPFDRVIHEAAAQGIRFYPINSQGMTSTFATSLASASALNLTSGSPAQSRARFRQARDTLASMASETGGHAFLNGQRASKVAERLEGDFSCLYVASFDPSGMPEDSPLRVIVRPKREDITIQVRGQMVIQSQSARTTSRLLNAFAEPRESTAQDYGVQSNVVPTGFADGAFTGLLQVSVPALPLQEAVWDLGATVLRGEQVGAESSGRIAVPRPGVAVVFERELRFKPGAYEIVSVAHEASTGLVTSHQLGMSWPELKKQPVTVSPIAVLQHSVGAFLRDGAKRGSGALAVGGLEPVHSDRDVALIGLICRGRGFKDPVQVARQLKGESTVDFPGLEVDFEGDRCVQFRDLVPAKTLSEGYYQYEIRVSKGERTLEETQRGFYAITSQFRTE